MRLLLIFLLYAMLAMQCSSETTELMERDLLQYGMPITLSVPDSVDIKTMDWGLQKDVTLKGDDNYNLQIFSSQTSTPNMAILLSQHKEMVRENPYFNKFVQEDADGFIYELQVDSLANFNFRHFKIQGDREYIFQTGMVGNYTQEEASRLYQISQEAK